MCAKVVDINFSRIKLIPEWYKTQEMCDRVVSEDLFKVFELYTVLTNI